MKNQAMFEVIAQVGIRSTRPHGHTYPEKENTCSEVNTESDSLYNISLDF